MEGLGSNISRLAKSGFLYLITNRKLFHNEQAFLDAIEAALKAGVDIVQLREKDLDTLSLFRLCQKLKNLTNKYKALLLINDRIDIALATKADGVHLPGNGLPTEVARKFLGEKAIIGRSTHSLEEVKSEQGRGADFLTFSPIFYTKSKAKYGNPQGLNKLKEICRCSHIPIVALGGINKDNVISTLSVGAKGIAVISAVLGSDNTFLAATELNKLIKSFFSNNIS